MQSIYEYVKLTHIILSVLVLGMNLTYLGWLQLGRKDNSQTRFVLAGIRMMDSRYTATGYLLILLTGLFMMGVGPYPHSSLWMIFSVVLLIVLMGIAHGVFTPTLKKALADSQQGDVPVLLLKRLHSSGIVVLLIALIILVMMVLKRPL